MGLWVMILLVTVGPPGLAVFWWAAQRAARQDQLQTCPIDLDRYEAEEMLVALGSTQEWV